MSGQTSRVTRNDDDNSVVEYQLEPVLPSREFRNRDEHDGRVSSMVPQDMASTPRLLAHGPSNDSRTVVPGFGDFHTYIDQRKRKLAEQSEERVAKLPASEAIFSEVVFHINGYTQPSHYELKRLLLERGGRFLHYLSKTQVTHIIASSLTMSKEKEFRNYKVVRPEWVVDSVRVGKQLPWHKYRLIGQGNIGASINALSDPLSQLSAQPARQGSESGNLGLLVKPTLVIDRFNEGLNRSWVRKNLASDKDFIKRYYKNSRLHHLSTWKAEMKDYVAQLRSKYRKGKGTDKKVDRGNRIIMHVDFDCFFVTASLLSHPYLKDKPVAVCHSQQQQQQPVDSDQIDEESLRAMSRLGGTSQIASCNYTARSFGVRNGMFLGPAREKCPGLMSVPYYFDTYKRISRRFYEELTRIADEIQAVSIDEALLDVTEAVHHGFGGSPERLAHHIRQIIYEQTQCVVSIGIGPNILLARVATNKAKPDGVFTIAADQFDTIDLKVRDLPGIGYTLEKDLVQHNIASVRDVRNATLAELQAICGEKTGQALYEHSRGIDNRVLESDKLRQAFGADIGWGVRFSSQQEADDFIRQLSAVVCEMMSVSSRTGRSVTLKIKKRRDGEGKPHKFLGHGICDSLSKSTSLSSMTSDPAKISAACIDLLRQLNTDPLDIRSVGIQVSKLNSLDVAGDISNLLAKTAASTPKFGIANSVMELPSASQLDTSVLDELPESIRQELQAAYQQIDPSISIAKGEETSKPKIIPTPAGSSSAVHRPGRKASGGSGYSGRGRPRKLVFPLGSSTKIVQRAGPASGGQSLMKAFRKVEALDLVMPSQMDSSVWEELPMSIRRELAREYAKSDSAQGSAKEEKADAGRQVHLPAANAGLPEDVPQVSDTELAAPTLFNRSNLNEVLDLVRKWVDTCANEPLVEDIEEFSNYAVSLVKFRDLASSERVVNHLQFWAGSKGVGWQQALDIIIGNVNSVCVEMYGCVFR